MRDEVSQLVAALREAKSFEDAAGLALRAVMGVADQALAESPHAANGRILRGTVQLRPGDSLRRLVVLEGDSLRKGGALDAPLKVDSSTFVTSATAWNAVVEHRCPVSIDVNLGICRLHGLTGTDERTGKATAMMGGESRQQFLGRQATHVLVLPLLMPGGGVDGLISIEAECRPATGQDFIWPRVLGRLELIADLSTPFLAGLPSRPGSAPVGDEYLPVIGTAMASLVPILRAFAQQEETMLLSGPAGVGKSHLARWCHQQSLRRARPYEVLDLVTVREDLQLAELFGWRGGALTGAASDNPGSLARAEGGTLFIDEVDKLSLKAQAGLLHVLEKRSYRPVGEGAGERPANVRLIVSTNADLRAAVRAGQFRQDLYYRISVLPVRVPPLEERRDEIARWAQHLLNRRHSEVIPGGQARMTAEVERLLSTAPWPGNLRQLDNIIRRAYTLAVMDRGGVGHEVVLQERHVSHALAYEDGTSSPRALVDQLMRAALGFLLEAQARSGGLNLNLADAFRGFVLGMAVQQLGREEAFRLFGKERLVRNRNHHKTLRREMQKVDALLRAIGQGKSPFADLLSAEPEESTPGERNAKP